MEGIRPTPPIKANDEGKMQFSGMIYWKLTDEETILVDPFHIRALGFKEQNDNAGNKVYVVWADIGTGTSLTFIRQKKQESLDWFELLQKAKARN